MANTAAGAAVESMQLALMLTMTPLQREMASVHVFLCHVCRSHVPADLQKQVCVEANNAGLVWLSDVGEDAVDHGHKHAVPQRVARVVDDRDYVRPVLRHVHQVPAAAVAELNRVHVAGWTNDVGDVGD